MALAFFGDVVVVVISLNVLRCQGDILGTMEMCSWVHIYGFFCLLSNRFNFEDFEVDQRTLDVAKMHVVHGVGSLSLS